MRQITLLVLVGLVIGACNAGAGDRACDLLEEFPERVSEVFLGEVEELADAALDSDTAEIRAVGEQLTSMLRRRGALENLAPGASADILDSERQKLQRACSNLD